MRTRITNSCLLCCWTIAAFVAMGNGGSAFQQTDPRGQSEPQQAPANPANSHTGEFDAFGQGYIRMSIEGQNSHIHNVTEQTQVTIDGKPARLNDLRTGDRIRVTTGPNNVATKIEVAGRGEKASANAQQETRRRPDFGEQSRVAELEQPDNEAAWLGVVLKPSGEGQEGVELTQIYPSGPAARAGLYSGDVLVQIAGEKVSSPEQAAKLIEQMKPNEAVELVVIRGGRRQTVQANLAARRDFLFEERFQGQDGEDSAEFDRNQFPDHSMMLEQHRHFAEQHQRIERKLDQVLKELDDLRAQLGQNPQRGRDARDVEREANEAREPQEAIEEAPKRDKAANETTGEGPETERSDNER